MNAKGLAMNPLQSLYYVSPACLMCLAVPFGAWVALVAAAEPGGAGRSRGTT